MKKIFSLSVVCALALIFCFDSFAGLIDWERRNRFLKERQQNSGSEKAMTEDDLPLWMREEPIIKTRAEKRYDVNRDGKFQPAESKVYLRRVIKTVEKGGKIVSRSDILEEYDTNGDGVISLVEVKEVREDVL